MRYALNSSPKMTWCSAFPRQMARWAGQPELAALVGGLIFVWAIGGRTAHLSDDWHLISGLGAILATFFLVYLIQNGPATASDDPGEAQLPDPWRAGTPL